MHVFCPCHRDRDGRRRRKPEQRVGTINNIIMRTFSQRTRAAVLGASVLMLAVGCGKQELEEATTAGSTTLAVPKVDPWFVKSNSGAGTFKVFLWYPSCVTSYGNITSWTSAAPDNLVVNPGGSPSYVRATNSNCTIDANNLRLQRGTTAGTYGPWYLIRPNFGPSVTVRKMLKVRVKNTALIGNTYNKDFLYDPVTNNWSWSVSTSDSYEVQQISGVPALCM